jgi:hypothetical protein
LVVAYRCLLLNVIIASSSPLKIVINSNIFMCQKFIFFDFWVTWFKWFYSFSYLKLCVLNKQNEPNELNQIVVNFKRAELELKKKFVLNSNQGLNQANSKRVKSSSDRFDSTRLISSPNISICCVEYFF